MLTVDFPFKQVEAVPLAAVKTGLQKGEWQVTAQLSLVAAGPFVPCELRCWGSVGPSSTCLGPGCV